MNNIKTVAIIPARGGSKGIPRKNLVHVAGKPLLAWSIEAAQTSLYVERVIVSTDDQEIADCAHSFGAEVVMRPAYLSGDEASSEVALLHVLKALQSADHYHPDLVVFLQCTSPLTRAEDVDGTIEALLGAAADTALAVTPFHYFLWEKDSSGNVNGINHDASVRLRRQDSTPQFIETGAVYVMRAEGFIHHGHRFFGRVATYEMLSESHWEIDDPVDLEIAEVMKRRQVKDQYASFLPADPAGVVLDFDGVFTDNKVTVSQSSCESVVCSRSDGWGLAELRSMGIPVVVISTEQNPVVASRCTKLGLECLQGVDDKLVALKSWAVEKDARLKDLIFVGNDVNDATCLRVVGCPVLVADAYPDILPLARIVLNKKGGEGALRELVELLKQQRKGGGNG